MGRRGGAGRGRRAAGGPRDGCAASAAAAAAAAGYLSYWCCAAMPGCAMLHLQIRKLLVLALPGCLKSRQFGAATLPVPTLLFNLNTVHLPACLPAAAEQQVEILEQGPGQQQAERPRITTRYLTKYEKARVLGTRALQVRQVGAPLAAWGGGRWSLQRQLPGAGLEAGSSGRAVCRLVPASRWLWAHSEPDSL